MAEKQEAIVIAKDEQAEQLSELAERLKAAGCEVVSELDFIGQIIVRVDGARFDEIRKMEGVAEIERSGEVGMDEEE